MTFSGLQKIRFPFPRRIGSGSGPVPRTRQLARLCSETPKILASFRLGIGRQGDVSEWSS